MWHVTCDMWHVTHDTWHRTHAMWHMVGWWIFSQNFSSPALPGWDTQCLEDSELNHDLMNEWMNDEPVYRKAPATSGLLNILRCKVSTGVAQESPGTVSPPGWDPLLVCPSLQIQHIFVIVQNCERLSCSMSIQKPNSHIFSFLVLFI